jgi:hypothetical protein
VINGLTNMLLEIEEHIAQNTPTFFDYEVKIDKLSQDNLALKMRLKEMENEMLKAKIESMEIQLKANSDYFERKQAEFDAIIKSKIAELDSNLSSTYEYFEKTQKDPERNVITLIENIEKRNKEIENARFLKVLKYNYENRLIGNTMMLLSCNFVIDFGEEINEICYSLGRRIRGKPITDEFIDLNELVEFIASILDKVRVDDFDRILSKKVNPETIIKVEKICSFLNIEYDLKSKRPFDIPRKQIFTEKSLETILKYVKHVNTF